MNRKLYALVLIVILLGTVLSACTRSASNAAVGQPTAITELPFPVDNAKLVTEIVQQTQGAQAPAAETPAAQTTPVVVATEVPQVVVPTVAPTMIVVATPTRPAAYSLQKGEWPICIARRYNLDLNTFFSQNNLTMSSRPAAGTSLKIPTSGTWNSGERALKAHPAQYTVKAGDTIYTIACAYGDVAPEVIAQANNLQSPFTLTSGQVLQIP